jgi:CheY-like chemotaxis protein
MSVTDLLLNCDNAIEVSTLRKDKMDSLINTPEQMELSTVLLVEDSEHDILAIRRIWNRLQIQHSLTIVKDGKECLDYLFRCGQYADPEKSPVPRVLLLDLNMPKLDGFDVLDRIKSTPGLCRLPVIILTTSSRSEDVNRAYDLGANIYLSKPAGVQNLTELLVTLNSLIPMMKVSEEIMNGNWRNENHANSACRR